mgnify:CR=1 FL=1
MTSPHKTRRDPRRLTMFGAAAAAIALTLTACGGGASKPAPADSSSASAPAAASNEELKSFYEQKIDWKKCDDFECGELTVPLNYEKPDEGSITLALIRAKATEKSERSLVVNPGGPGGSGVNMVKDSATVMFSRTLRQNYDIVGFDPRGVGQSTSVNCFTDEDRDQQMSDSRMPNNDDQSVDEIKKAAEADVVKCKQKTKPEELLSQITTPNSAHDMDILRAALGEEKLDYLGYSYGTKLGAQYLSMFPGNAGRMVLDAAMDPSLGIEEVALDQAKSFEESLDHYLESCAQQTNCWFDGDVADGRKKLTYWINEWDAKPLKIDDGRQLTGAAAFEAILLPMYEPAAHEMLTEALNLAIKQKDPSGLVFLWDLSNDREMDGTYRTNSSEAFRAYNCMDYKLPELTEESRQESRKKFAKEAPFYGEALSESDGCAGWPNAGAAAQDRFTVSDEIPPVLVVGTKHDPATPYHWAESLQKQLPGSTLLTWDGWGHTAYGRSNMCVTAGVDKYLTQGEMPSKTSC